MNWNDHHSRKTRYPPPAHQQATPQSDSGWYDITDLMVKPGASSPYEKFFYYRIDQLRAVRSGKWKLHLACDPTLLGWDGIRRGTCKQALYDLSTDIERQLISRTNTLTL